MNQTRKWISLGLLLMIMSACAPATEAPIPTPLPATPVPVTTQPTLPAPTLFPVTLTGAQAGEMVSWMDSGTLVYIPAGKFLMGMDQADAPLHEIYVDAYWIHQTKVTFGMYQQCIKVGACTAPSPEVGAPDYNNLEFSSYPVVGVTWQQATDYCSWTQGRLPTEAEWEKAARGTDGRTYPWGNDEPACDLANLLGCYAHTTDTTDFPNGKSIYGVFDMSGNVFEWANDWYSPTYYSESPAENPTGPVSADYRVIRGTSFESDLTQAHIATRHFNASANHRRDIGFRCVVPKPPIVAPYCQLQSYLPGGTASSFTSQAQACDAPNAQARGNYCAGGVGYATLDIPAGAVYEVLSKDFNCTEAVVDGQRRVTCSGPKTLTTTAEITVCNPQCSGASTSNVGVAACDPGYTVDPSSSACNYSPISGAPDVAGCPVGYIMIDRGAEKTCALLPNQNGLCPSSMYYDSSYGACISVSGIVEVPYGINRPDTAAQLYAGCASGYSYDANFQCCQAVIGGNYPNCPPGTTFNNELGACAPGDVRLSGPGCVTVSLTTIKCSEREDFCSKIKAEATCLRASYACSWNDVQNVCTIKPTR